MPSTRLPCLLFLLAATAVHGFFVPAPLAATTPHRRSSLGPLASTTATAAPAAAAAGVVTETLVLPMGDDTQLKIRFRQESFKTLALRTNQVGAVDM